MQNDYEDELYDDYYHEEEDIDPYDELMKIEAEKASEFYKMSEQDFEDDYQQFYGEPNGD